MTPVTLGSVSPALENPAVGPTTASDSASPTSFSDALGQAIGSLDKVELEADRNADQVALGGGNLHETALSLAKADTAMRLALKVRNKIVDAYQEVMRMSV
jgi:flagellar hook-basal body complex protein FliE